jgi:branched-chain amino acid transport system permease protein
MKVVFGWPFAILAALAVYPLFPALDQWFFHYAGRSLGDQMPTLFILGVLALALNVVVGYTGLLHLGIAAFFGIGAYITGILTVPAYPFEVGFWVALIVGSLGTAAVGALIGLPTLRLRGDYLALVTLGFGEVVRYTLRNLDAITAGTRGLNPVPPPVVPGLEVDWTTDYRPFYYLTLLFLAGVYLVLGSVERSRLGRAWVAIREDELAATCMGLNAARLKLAAFVVAAGVAGLAGCLYASRMASTGSPDSSYDFNRSITVLCCLILGGLGSRSGALFGVFILFGFDNVLAPILDAKIQERFGAPEAYPVMFGDRTLFTLPGIMLTFTGWKLSVFGLVLILVMRFRPEGLFPTDRMREEIHPEPHPGVTVEETP